MSLIHTPAHTTSHPDHFQEKLTGKGYDVVQDTDAEDPRGCIENEHAALWAYSQPSLGSSVAGDMPEGNVAITAFAHYFEYFDEVKSLDITRRYLAVFHPEKQITVETHTIRGYSQSDWLDLVVATADGYGTPASHAEEFRMWAYGDVWTVIPDEGDAVSGIYADDAEEALKFYLTEEESNLPAPSYTLTPSDHNDDLVTVSSSDGQIQLISREDADPEHRFLSYRLAAAYFGNQPAEKA